MLRRPAVLLLGLSLCIPGFAAAESSRSTAGSTPQASSRADRPPVGWRSAAAKPPGQERQAPRVGHRGAQGIHRGGFVVNPWAPVVGSVWGPSVPSPGGDARGPVVSQPAPVVIVVEREPRDASPAAAAEPAAQPALPAPPAPIPGSGHVFFVVSPPSAEVRVDGVVIPTTGDPLVLETGVYIAEIHDGEGRSERVFFSIEGEQQLLIEVDLDQEKGSRSRVLDAADLPRSTISSSTGS